MSKDLKNFLGALERRSFTTHRDGQCALLYALSTS